MNIESLTTFLGWCTLINYGLLIIATVVLVVFGRAITRIHSKLFRLESEHLASEYFRYLANFKIVVIVFNLVPWVVLRFLM